MVVHNWRPLNTYDLIDPAEDLRLQLGGQVSGVITFQYPEEERNTGITLKISSMDAAISLHKIGKYLPLIIAIATLV